MRKLSKGTTIAASIIICLFLVIGFIFSFVPMTFGSKTYVSLIGSLNVSSDIMGGMYGEYDITTENPTPSNLLRSMSKIKEVFEGDGYKNVNVYSIDNSKIRIELSYPSGDKTYTDVHSDLSAVSSGRFYLSSSNSAAEVGDDSIVEGSLCVKEVKVFTNNSTNYLSIVFNDYGVKQYEALYKASTSGSIYLHLGTYSQQISINKSSGTPDYSSFTLSDSDYKNIVALQKRVIIGCMDVEINSSTAIINTMSASLSSAGSASSPEEKGFGSSTAMVMLITALLVVIVVGIALFAMRFGLFAVVVAISLMFNVYLFLIALCLIPSVEIGFSSILSLILGMSVIYTYTFIYANAVKSEYEVGKSFGASLESAFKKTVANSLIGNISLFFAALIVFAFAFGEISSASIVFAVCSFLSILTNFLFIPLLVKVGISFNKIGPKLFMLKKRSMSLESVEVQDIELKESK